MNSLEYFFECYYNESADYTEIDELISEFVETEDNELVFDFKVEIELIIENSNWDKLVRGLRDFGGRRVNTNQGIELALRLHEKLK